jgi:imidazolonepropionase-like amidohydrolase
VNADVFRLPHSGRVRPGNFADLVVVQGDPVTDMRQMRKVIWVMKDGIIYDPGASASR